MKHTILQPLFMLSTGALLLQAAGCGEEPPTNCPCFFSEAGNAYLLGDAEIRTVETNSSERAIRGDRDMEIEGNLELDQTAPSGTLKLKIPYPDLAGEKHYREMTVSAANGQEELKKFIAQVCLKERLYTDPVTCRIKPEYVETYSKLIDELADNYLKPVEEAQIPKRQNPSSEFRQTVPQSYSVRIMFPNEVGQPSVRINPEPIRKEVGKFSCVAEIRTGNYRIELEENGHLWAAHFDHQSGLVAPFLFTKINAP